MTSRLMILFFVGLMNSTALSAQCPDRALLWKRLNFFVDSSSIVPNGEQLRELSKYEQDLNSCPDKIDSTFAFLLLRIGVCYLKQANYYQAIQFIRQSIHVIDANIGKPSVNGRYLASYYYRLAICYDSLHDLPEKMKAVDSCIVVAIRANSVDESTLYSLAKSVEYFKDIGDFEKCIHYAKLGETLAKNYKRDLNSTEYFLRFLEWELDELLVLNKYDEAEKIISINLRSFQVEECRKAGAWGFLSTLYEQYAEVLTYKHEYSKALYWFNQSIYYDEKKKNFLGCAITMGNVGYILYCLQLKDFDKAIVCFNKALQYADKEMKSAGSGDLSYIRIESLNILDNIAISYKGKGLYDTAVFFFQKAFDQIKPGMNELSLLQSSDSEFFYNKSILYLFSMIIDKADAIFLWGKVSGNPGKIKEALVIYKTTDRLLNRIKSEQTEIKSKLFWRKETRRLYEHAIEASYLTGNTTDAFYFFEKSRAVLLSDQLYRLNKISNEDILNQSRVQKKLLRLDIELSNTDHSSKRYDEIQTELFKGRQESDRLDQLIKRSNPLYYQNFLDTSFISLQDVHELILNNHEGLLEIFSGDSSVYSILITMQQIKFKKIPKPDFANCTSSYISYISNPVLLNRQFANFIKMAGHLYQLIFQNDPPPDGRIIISPDGQIFPFESLVMNTNISSPVYFLQNHAVSYTYSARYLLTDFEASKSMRQTNFLGVAPVQFSSAPSLSALFGSDLSINQIGSYFADTHNLIAADASKNNFQQQFSNYDIIQLYTHASDSSLRGEPVIYFADSVLYLSDLIPESKPRTQLIVLSACETGKGKLYLGEGVFSFNRGFASLGIPSSVINLWAVDNKSTYQITELFYKYLARGMPIDIALQKAKLEFVQQSSKQNQLSYYWASTILAGKSDAIEYERKFPWPDILIVAFLAGLSFFVWQKLGKKKN